MDGLIKLFVDSIQYIWPFRIVDEMEEGGYYIFGRWYWHITPGLYPILPFFTDVRSCSMAEAIIGTGRRDITVADGSVLSFDALLTVAVVDPYKAMNIVDDYKETARELGSAVLAYRLADVGADRLQPDKRGRLLSDLKTWCDSEAAEYGLAVRKVRFASFLTNVKTYRLLSDQTKEALW